MDRMIECSACGGSGEAHPAVAIFGPRCGPCRGTGRIPDRRAPIASDADRELAACGQAVERIKRDASLTQGVMIAGSFLLAIIREEAERE